MNTFPATSSVNDASIIDIGNGNEPGAGWSDSKPTSPQAGTNPRPSSQLFDDGPIIELSNDANGCYRPFRMSFADYLNDFAPAGGTMHLMHSTAVGRGARIIVQGELRTRDCPEYGQDLVYLFYGRPAYKPLPGLAASGIDEHLPMCLVIDPALLDDAVRILPFDSGGYPRYAAHTGPLLGRPDFELGPGREVPMRLVRAFFQTNRNYYRQSPTADHAAIPMTQAAARAYARLSRDVSIGDDDRRSTVEIQIARAVPLAGALKAVVGPTTLLTDPEVTTALDALPTVTRVSYDTFGSQQPSAYTALLYDRVASFLTSEGVMS